VDSVDNRRPEPGGPLGGRLSEQAEFTTSNPPRDGLLRKDASRRSQRAGKSADRLRIVAGVQPGCGRPLGELTGLLGNPGSTRIRGTARCTRRLPSSMKTSTWRRCKQTLGSVCPALQQWRGRRERPTNGGLNTEALLSRDPTTRVPARQRSPWPRECRENSEPVQPMRAERFRWRNAGSLPVRLRELAESGHVGGKSACLRRARRSKRPDLQVTLGDGWSWLLLPDGERSAPFPRPKRQCHREPALGPAAVTRMERTSSPGAPGLRSPWWLRPADSLFACSSPRTTTRSPHS
jgi:hypothetical protein